jgi:hypothetical protein
LAGRLEPALVEPFHGPQAGVTLEHAAEVNRVEPYCSRPFVEGGVLVESRVDLCFSGEDFINSNLLVGDFLSRGATSPEST